MSKHDLVGKRVRVKCGTDIDGADRVGLVGTLMHVDADALNSKHPYELRPEVQDYRGVWRESGRWTWLSADSELEVV